MAAAFAGSSAAEAPTRQRFDGARDKLCLIEAMAWKFAHDHDVDRAVRAAVSHVGNSALDQVRAWQSRCERMLYRREAGERYRHPISVLRDGGDCDDQVIVFCAGMRALGLPCKVEILVDESGWAYHVRARAGVPPVSPTIWLVVDPVRLSERQWAMVDQKPDLPLPAPSSTSSLSGLSGESTRQSGWTVPILAFLGLLAAAKWLGDIGMRPKRR